MAWRRFPLGDSWVGKIYFENSSPQNGFRCVAFSWRSGSCLASGLRKAISKAIAFLLLDSRRNGRTSAEFENGGG